MTSTSLWTPTFLWEAWWAYCAAQACRILLAFAAISDAFLSAMREVMRFIFLWMSAWCLMPSFALLPTYISVFHRTQLGMLFAIWILNVYITALFPAYVVNILISQHSDRDFLFFSLQTSSFIVPAWPSFENEFQVYIYYIFAKHMDAVFPSSVLGTVLLASSSRRLRQRRERWTRHEIHPGCFLRQFSVNVSFPCGFRRDTASDKNKRTLDFSVAPWNYEQYVYASL